MILQDQILMMKMALVLGFLPPLPYLPVAPRRPFSKYFRRIAPYAAAKKNVKQAQTQSPTGVENYPLLIEETRSKWEVRYQ